MKSIYQFSFFIFLLIALWWVIDHITVDSEEEKIYSFLITKDVPSSTLANINSQEILSSWILFYNFPEGVFFLFEIDDTTMVKINDGFYLPIHKNKTFLKEQIAKYYGISEFDFEINFNQKELIEFLYENGGAPFFNLYSTNLPLGEVYINSLNYINFLTGIENTYLKKITAMGFWFNLLISFQERLPHAFYTEDFLKNFHSSFSGNLNYLNFFTLLSPLLQPKQVETGGNENTSSLLQDQSQGSTIRDHITFKLHKNSIEADSQNINQPLIPYQNGVYDKTKIQTELKEMSKPPIQRNSQNITAQIKNATTVNRLAARAAGFFRLKGINIIEYLRFSALLDHSVILDFSNHPLKRNYIKQITKINKVYHLFNYRENYDFGIYLGTDLYVLQNQTNNNNQE